MCGGSYERFLNLCANHRIFLWDVRPVQKGYEANIHLKDFFSLKPLAAKCRTRVRVCKKCGLPFFLNRHRKRKVFAAGLLASGFFIFFLSCFVWNISIDGNVSISRPVIMEYLMQQEIGYGTPKRAIDCKQLSADLRNDFPNLTWVSVKLSGTELSINVQENMDAVDETGQYLSAAGESGGTTDAGPSAAVPSDLVADEGGTIVKMITREGTPLVKEGDVITAGDSLVSGELAITDDSDTVVSYRYCRADADVYIQTTLPYHDEFPLIHDTPEYTGRKRYGFYIKLFGRFYGVDLGIDAFETADIIGRERQLCLFQDFYLPVSAGILRAQEYRIFAGAYTKKEALDLAEANLQKFLTENEEKGVQIFENDVRIEISATTCQADGTITVIKKTGRHVRTEKTDLRQEGTDE